MTTDVKLYNFFSLLEQATLVSLVYYAADQSSMWTGGVHQTKMSKFVQRRGFGDPHLEHSILNGIPD